MKIALALVLALVFGGTRDAPSSDAAQLLLMIDQARVAVGLAPYAANAALSAAAQAHADDMAGNGVGIGHTGSDGSTPASRIVRAGYPGYSWGPYAGENWAAYQTIQDSMNAWMNDPPHRSNILNSGYREIGVGVSHTHDGAPILVTDFGAQPNVLPVFSSGTGSTITLTLSNEDAVPLGDGPSVIGQAIGVDISEDPAFSAMQSFPYARSIEYKSADGKTLSTTYVRFHDAAGRTTVSTASPSPLAFSQASPTATTVPPAATSSPTVRPPTITVTRRPHTLIPTALAAVSTTLQPTDEPSATEAPSPTPTAIRPLAVRQPYPTPEPIVTSLSADAQLLSPPSVALFVASGLVLVLAMVTFIRGRGG